MIGRTTGLALAVLVGMALAGCGEKPQTSGTRSAAKADAAPYTGGETGRFAADGFKPGDKNAWAQQLKARAHNTQSDYTRIAN